MNHDKNTNPKPGPPPIPPPRTANLPPITRFLFIGAAFTVLVAGLQAAKAIVVPFLLALFIAIIAAPALVALQRRRVPTGPALLLVLSAIVIGFLLLFSLIGNSVESFSGNLPAYQERIDVAEGNLLNWLEDMGMPATKDALIKHANVGATLRLASNMLAGLGGAMTNFFLIFLTVIFILLEAADFPAKLQAGLKQPDQTLVRLSRFIDDLKRYAAIKTVLSLLTGLLVALWLTILGVDYPMLWGILAFLLNYIPNIGSIIAAVPAVVLAFIQLGTVSALLAAAGYVAINLVIGNALEPRYMGRSLGLSTLVVFLSLIFWGWVFGPVGMLLSVPLTMTVKIALDSNRDTRWLAILMGPARALQPMVGNRDGAPADLAGEAEHVDPNKPPTGPNTSNNG